MRVRLLGLPAAVLVALLPILVSGALLGPTLVKAQKVQQGRHPAQFARTLPRSPSRARPQVAGAATQAATFPANFNEGFEGAWPSAGWTLQDFGNSGGEYLLGKRGCNPLQGAFAGWTVGGGANGSNLSCNANYPDNVYSVAVYGPFDLTNMVSSVLTYNFIGSSEANYDQLFVGASIDGNYYCGNYQSGALNDAYHQDSVDLSNLQCSGVPSSLLGQTSVTIAVMFISDESNNDIGFTIDNLRLVSQGAAATSTPTIRSTNTPTIRPTNTPTSIPTDTPVGTATNTPVGQPTNTPTSIPTDTPTDTPTSIPTDTPTDTPTQLPTSTPTTPATNLNLTVSQIETTQAVQTGQNNVPLIAGRPVVVRVSVGVQNSATAVLNVTGRLHGVRNGVEITGSPLSPFNARDSIVAQLSPNRANFDDTLNFQLPIDWTTGGPITLWAEVNPNHTIDEATFADNRSADLPVNFRTVPTLQIMLVPIAYQPGGQGTILRPDLTQNNQGLSNLQNLYPIADVRATLHSEYLFTGNLNSNGWEKLLDELTAVRNRELGAAARTSKLVYYGVVPQGVVAGQNSFTAGIGWVGGNLLTSVGLEASNGVAAHEIGHNLGLNHAPCGVAGDPDYPFADGRTGDVGVDVYQRQLHSDGEKDFMSYCRPIWVSAFHYLKMLQALTQAAPPPPHGAIPAQAGNGLLIAGSIYSDTVSGAFTSNVPVNNVTADTGDASGSYRVDLRDSGGVVQYSYQFSPTTVDSHTTAPSFGFSFTAPQVANLASIELYKGNTLISSQQASPAPPSLTATATSTVDAITVTWQASSSDGVPVQVAMRYSPDNGLSWRLLGTNIAGNSFVLSKRNLPSSSGGLLEVIATNNGQSTTKQLNTGSISNKPPVVSIAGNSSVQTYVGQPIVVQATALDLEDGYLQGNSLVWTDENGTTLGVGENLVLSDGLPRGSHTLTITATDSNGARTQDAVNISVVNPPPVRVNVTYSIYIPVARRP